MSTTQEEARWKGSLEEDMRVTDASQEGTQVGVWGRGSLHASAGMCWSNQYRSCGDAPQGGNAAAAAMSVCQVHWRVLLLGFQNVLMTILSRRGTERSCKNDTGVR